MVSIVSWDDHVVHKNYCFDLDLSEDFHGSSSPCGHHNGLTLILDSYSYARMI